jgi:crossover junction endodeoxyribonuclease RuvC
LIAEHQPSVVAIERVLFQTNVRTAMSVGQASGVVLAEAANAGCEGCGILAQRSERDGHTVGVPPPRTGERMVRSLLGIDQRLKPVDAADALALALCHLARVRGGGGFANDARSEAMTSNGAEAMIGSLRGDAARAQHRRRAARRAGGVGYRVTTTPELASGFGAVGDEVFVHIITTCAKTRKLSTGFAAKMSASVFEALLSAHGVGPSLALAIMAGARADAGCTPRARGGRRRRVVHGPGHRQEDRHRASSSSSSPKLQLPVVDLANLSDSSTPAERAVHADVRDALLGLGYTQDERSAGCSPICRLSAILRCWCESLATHGGPRIVTLPTRVGTSCSIPTRAIPR